MPKKLSKNCIFFESVKEIPQSQWNLLMPKNGVYLSLPYLTALEKTLKGTINPIYVLISDPAGKPLLAGMFQISTFTYKKTSQQNLFLKLFQDCRNEDDSFSIKGLVCGNMFATGEHGFSYSEEISKENALTLLAKTAKQIQKDARWKDLFKVILFKEFWLASVKNASVLEDYKYRSFQVDVNMVLKLHPSWKTFADYLQSLKAKYRTKANSAFKKSEKLVIRSLSSEEIDEQQTNIQRLFSNVLNKSEYRYGENYPASFAVLKENLRELFICKGVFLNSELIAFSTAFVNGNTLEANYVGIDYKYNTEYAVYERLLYEYVEQAIALKVSELHLGRTSELIKSAVGAVPVAMTLYARHTSKIKNVLLKPVLENIEPNAFELRRPFGEFLKRV
ncbi:MAG: GNAT family N-acetyltransferase [Aequorivita sp.]|nr:GNAT family N-acetyltransferase [Aequorivita sp.]